MSIESVTQMWSRQTGNVSTDDNKTFKASFASAYQVVHSAGATRQEILTATGIPQLGDVYPGTSYVYCKQVGDVQPVGPILSIVPVSYSGEIGPNGQDDNPLNKPPDIQWTNAKTSEPIDEDGYGFPICNTNGELVDGISKDISDFVLTVKRNYAAIDIYSINAYLDSVNSDTFAGWPPGTGTLDAFTADSVLDDDVGYWTVSAKIIFRVPYRTTPARAWWARYRNEGFYVRYGTRVLFSGGGGGTGAAGYAVATGGAISEVVVTNRGRGYTSSPSVGFTSDTGGSGASASASVAGGEVTGVTVSAGGTGYKSGIDRAVDKNKEPVTKPVLLKINGEQEPDASNAVWLERPKKAYTLPYSALGLL